ncbi:Peptidyl-prolyl cis-trans isomerase FKBP62 [Porphyridium purpureum]|uniref:peptidylprolyl isomerase n=1 Tax=Porphyridium purpureum TaxID=35688 RepID=A0A5J4YP08_PORPP|nr:Peptidyl-prolyl cis-trans isomerase FKBP62 [Porphyridium purpureum]|eukprot:POR4530..scf222_8
MIPVTNDGGVRKSVVTKAESSTRPGLGSRVWLWYTLRLQDDSVLESCQETDAAAEHRRRPFSFRIGSKTVIRGLELAVMSMSVGEASEFVLEPDYAFGQRGKGHVIPPDAAVKLDIRLLKTEGGDQTQNLMAMSPQERFQLALTLKEAGNEKFKCTDYAAAAECYEQALNAVSYVRMHVQDQDSYYASAKNDAEVDHKVDMEGVVIPDEDVQQLRLACLNNLALCNFKEGDHAQAEEIASKALSIDPENAKGFFYRGRARYASGKFSEARDDLREAAQRNPDNKGIRLELDRVEKKLSAQSHQERRVYGAMFSGRA